MVLPLSASLRRVLCVHARRHGCVEGRRVPRSPARPLTARRPAPPSFFLSESRCPRRRRATPLDASGRRGRCSSKAYFVSRERGRGARCALGPRREWGRVAARRGGARRRCPGLGWALKSPPSGPTGLPWRLPWRLPTDRDTDRRCCSKASELTPRYADPH